MIAETMTNERPFPSAFAARWSRPSRWVVASLVGLMVAPGCVSQSSPAFAQTAAVPTATDGRTAERAWTIGFVPKVVGIPYFDAMRRGLEAGSNAFGARLTYDGPTVASPTDQINIVQALVRRHLDAVGVSADSLGLLNDAALAARNHSVLFFSSDSQVRGPNVMLRVEPATPEDIATVLVDQVATALGHAGDIGLVTGSPTEANLFRWMVAIRHRIATSFPALRVVQTVYADDTAADAAAQTRAMLAADPAVNAIIGLNTEATAGAAAAVEAAGLTGQVVVTGLGVPDTIRPFIRRGVVKSVVLWNPFDLGYLTVWGVVQRLQGKTPAPVNMVPGLPEPVRYDAATRTLVLGKPKVITATEHFDLGV